MRGIIKKIDKYGRFPVPKKFREVLGINDNDDVLITLRDNEIVVTKHHKYAKCAITGKVTDDIKEYGNGVFLSEEGRRTLLEVLKNELE